MPSLPLFAYLKNHGRVRVMWYQNPNVFCVLTNRDERRFVRRDELVFTKPPVVRSEAL